MSPLSRVPRKIIPLSDIELKREADGQWHASQKGVMGGRYVKFDLSSKDPLSQKKIKSFMKEALKHGSEVFGQILPVSGQQKINLNLKKKAKVDIYLTIEGPVTLTPKISASQLKQKEKHPSIHQIFKYAISIFYKKFAFAQGHIVLNAPHLAAGSYLYQAAKIVQKVMDNERLDLELHPDAPQNFFEAHQEYLKNRRISPKKLTEKLDQLQPRECVLFPILTKNHLIETSAIKQNNGLFTLYLANTGRGIRYHFCKKNKRNEKIYQQVLIIEDISAEKLKDFISFICKNKRKDFSDQMYAEVNQLGILKKMEDSRFWNTAQLGGSCAGGAERALLKAMLTKKSYSELDAYLKAYSVFKLYKHIVSKSINNQRNKQGLLEIIQSLQRKKLSPEMDEALDIIKQKTEKLIKPSRQAYLPQDMRNTIFTDYAKITPPFRNLEDLLKRICFLTADGKYTEAHSLVVKLYHLPPSSPLTPSEKTVILNILKLYLEEPPKTRELMNLYYGLVAGIKKRDFELHPEIEKMVCREYERGKIQKFYPNDPWR